MDFLSNISSLDESRPTLYELIAQDQLRDLLQPAIRYVLAFYAERYPRYLLRLANSTDELYAAVMLIVESHFLKSYGGTFTENFYGLKRERASSLKSVSRTASAAPDMLSKAAALRRNDRLWSIVCIIGIPYVKAKLDEQWEIHGAPDAVLGTSARRSAALSPDASTKERLKHYTRRLFKSGYPTLNSAYYLSGLYFNLAYMFGSSNYHSVSHAFLRQRMRRLDGEDYRRIEASQAKPIELPPNSSLSPLVFLRLLLPRGISALKYLLPLGIFFLKFLEWWQASDFAAQLARKTSSSIDLPPPKKSPVLENLQTLNNSKKCRICNNEIVNPTAIQTGFVFCYVCAYKWVKEFSYCPITGQRLLTGVDGLRRLMI